MLKSAALATCWVLFFVLLALHPGSERCRKDKAEIRGCPHEARRKRSLSKWLRYSRIRQRLREFKPSWICNNEGFAKATLLVRAFEHKGPYKYRWKYRWKHVGSSSYTSWPWKSQKRALFGEKAVVGDDAVGSGAWRLSTLGSSFGKPEIGHSYDVIRLEIFARRELCGNCGSGLQRLCWSILKCSSILIVSHHQET